MKSIVAAAFGAATVALGLAAPLSDARAQVCVLQTEVTIYDQTSDGKPSTCGIDYVVVHREPLNRPGRLVAASGSFAWTAGDEHRFYLLHKLVGVDFEPPDQLPVPFQLNYDFVSTEAKSYARSELSYFPGENGGKLSAYDAGVAAELFAAVLRGSKLYVSYNRAPGQQDVRVPLELRGGLKTSDLDKFNACMTSIVKRAQSE